MVAVGRLHATVSLPPSSTSRPPEVGQHGTWRGERSSRILKRATRVSAWFCQQFSDFSLPTNWFSSPSCVCLSVIKAPPPSPPQQQSPLSEPTLEILFKPNCQPATSAAAPTVMCEHTLQSSSLGDRPRDCSFILLPFSDRWHRFPLNSPLSFGIGGVWCREARSRRNALPPSLNHNGMEVLSRC